MTITEALAAQAVLRALGAAEVGADPELLERACYLADRSYRVLQAGISGDTLRDLCAGTGGEPL